MMNVFSKRRFARLEFATIARTRLCRSRLLLSVLFVISLHAHAQHLMTDSVNVQAQGIDSRIQHYPASVEQFSRQQIQDSVNAVTPAQTLKYLPSVQVRERFIGDRNGIIASRTIGSISSAQSLLFADGVLLSNLLGNRWDFPPRWGMVNVEEIESVNMMYGPFSALYAGNSFGGVISIQTRMPEKWETHASAQYFNQSFDLYGTRQQYRGQHETASIGHKIHDLSLWLGVDRLENKSQPMDFAWNQLSRSTAAATPVTGGYRDMNEKNQARVIFGATNIDHSEQLNAKFKASYDLSATTKISYTLGLWDLDSRTDVQSYLRDSQGQFIYSGDVNLNGQQYTLPAMSPGKAEALHIMQAIDIKTNSKGWLDWQLTVSDYHYQQDQQASSRLSGSANRNPYLQRTGILNDLSGTGWSVLDARVTLRPEHHLIDFGYHIDEYQLKSTTHSSADWSSMNKENFQAASRGTTRTQAWYLQDKWQLHPHWAITLGGRQELWQASEGSNQSTNSRADYQAQSATRFSPKLSISYEPEPAWGMRFAFGQAYRFPSVTELYQQLSQGANIVTNNPDLKPEKVLSTELTLERRYANGLIRLSGFNEHKYDALIAQVNLAPVGTSTSYVQNVDHIRTYGLEFASEWKDVMVNGLDVLANATWTQANILQNSAAPSTQGNVAPRIPKQLYKAVASYRFDPNLTLSLAARYSGRQFINIDNSDSNDDVYRAASRFLMLDVKANYHMGDRWTAALGVDNLTNDQAYVSHPLPQRTWYAQIKFDY